MVRFAIDEQFSTTLPNRLRNNYVLGDGREGFDSDIRWVFLHRQELESYWEMSVFLDAPFEVTMARAAARDGNSPDVNTPENRRYVEGQRLYLEFCQPRRAATMVLDYEDLSSPKLAVSE